MATAMKAMSSARSAFAGQHMAFKGANVSPVVARPVAVTVQAKKVCDLTGAKRNKANSVSFSNKKNRKWQEPNLQNKKVYWAAGQRWVSLKITTRAIKTIEKNGLDAMAKEAGLDLWSLPFVDARPERKQYLAENQGKVPVAKNTRAIKNPEKIAASTKKPKYPVYEEGGRIIWIRPGMEDLIFGTSKAEEKQEQAAELKVTLSQ